MFGVTRTSQHSSLDSESRMTSAKRSRHCRCKTKSLLRNLQVSRLDLVTDAISSSGNRSDICRPGSDEGIENGVTGEREEFNQSFSETLWIWGRMPAPCRFAFDVDPR